MERKNCLIPRKKLMEAAEGPQASRLLYIQAPAGYGKTVFSGHWLENRPRPRAALTLDEYDDTVFDFCRKLRSLLQELYPEEVSVLSFTEHPAFDSAPGEFLMRAAGAVPRADAPSIVIDDLHNLTDPDVQRLLPVFLQRLPADTRVLILSRTAPPEVFSGMVLKEDLRLIPQEQMRFDSEEICDLYRGSRIRITKQQAEAILRYTEGWPIEISALLLSGVNVLNKSMPPAELEVFLKTQVWETWDEPSRAFMLATSVEEELTAELCGRLTGRPDSGEVLEDLLSRGAFLVKRSNESYRFHKLFREFLQKQFQCCSKEYRQGQYRLAGDYYLEREDFYRAIERFSQVGDPGRIARCFDLLERIDRAGFDTERVMKAVKEHVEEPAAEEYPFLFFMMAFTARNEGRIEDFKRYADAYYANYSRVVERNPELAHNIFFLYLMDPRYTMQDIARMAGGAPGGASLQGVRGSATSYFPLYHRSYRDFSELALFDLDAGIAAMDRMLGALLGGERAMLVECVRAGLTYEKGELPRAKELSLSAASKMQDGFAPESKFCVLVLLMDIDYAMGQPEEAGRIQREIQAMIETDRAYCLQFNFDAVTAKHRLSSGDTAAAQAWLNAHDTKIDAQAEFFRLYGLFTTARAHIAAGNFDRAVILLQKIAALCSAMKRPLDVIEAEILLSICRWKKKRGSQRAALEHLERAVEAAQPFGYEQVFINEGAELESMLSRLKTRTARSDYRGTLSGTFVKRLYLGAVQRAARGKGLTGGRVEENLRFTQQQKRVMKLLCEGCSYRRIGETLGIQFSTVRSHIELIYKKLDVSGAKEAVLKIQELQVLENE